MNKYFILLILPLFTIFGQSKPNCNCSALINPDYKQEILIFEKPNGKIIKKLRQDFINKNYLLLTIEKDSSQFFKVNIYFSKNENNAVKGWINKDKYIGTFTKKYTSEEKMNLYLRPNANSNIKAVVPEWTNQLYIIEKCSGKWVYVKTKYNEKIKEGWLQPEKQCINPSANCN